MKIIFVFFIFMSTLIGSSLELNSLFSDILIHNENRQLAFSSFIESSKDNYPFMNKKEKIDFLKQHTNVYIGWLENSCETFNLLKKYRQKNQIFGQAIFEKWINLKGTIFDSEYAMMQLQRNAIVKSNNVLLNEMKELIKLEKENSYKFNRILNLKHKLSQQSKKYLIDDIILKDLLKILKKQKALYIDFASTYKYDYIFTINYNGKITIDEIKKNDLIIQEFRNIMDGNKSLNTIDDMKYMLSITFNKIFPKHLRDKFEKLDINSTLIISPDGLMNFLPFEALVMNDKYLIEKFNIKYITSAKELVRLNNTKNIKTEEIVAFAKADFDTKIKLSKTNSLRYGISYNQDCKNSILELTNQTLKSTSSQKKSKKYEGKNASEKLLLGLNNVKNIDIITHGLYCKDTSILNPMSKTMLLMSGAKQAILENKNGIATDGKGIVTALEISTMNLKGTKLVTLSACQTGLGEINNAEGVSSINKAFILAGAKNVISTLWNVAINETDDLMGKFYQNKNAISNPSEVLKEVKLKFINDKQHPYFWSGFILYGE